MSEIQEIKNFIEEKVEADIAKNGPDYTVCTRFPPEPNGYLHIGHVRALSIDFGMKEKYNGKCNLRMDDTNPAKEDMHYVEAIKRDVELILANTNIIVIILLIIMPRSLLKRVLPTCVIFLLRRSANIAAPLPLRVRTAPIATAR